ncbi:MAG: PQQ-binding-like beta-propeller repeat protein, partial [Planctomycetes bacterium]|nr:PQQ-binding-like beta-propeller repeat protein [Planctomycetota bacterium]
LQKLLRAKATERLNAAAELLRRGELLAALAAYREVAAEPSMAKEAGQVCSTRMRSLLADLVGTSKALPARMPPPPGPLLDRRQMATNLADLQAACPPALQRAFGELQQLAQQDPLPPPLDPDLRAEIDQTVRDASRAFDAARATTTAYQEALQRNEQQRELDPLFKAAVEHETANDFSGALARYRELEQQPALAGELRAHFRDRVARNATIVRLLDALRASTTAGDFTKAQQHLRALRLSFPDVPFDTLVQLPLRVTSEPTGARVLCRGQDVGVTPLLLQRPPAEHTEVSVVMPGFRSAETTVVGDEVGEFCGRLVLVPDHSWRHGSAIETTPVLAGDGLVIVDRAGNVTGRRVSGDIVWTFRSRDLSGLLSAPIVHGAHVLFASLDGDVRCLDRTTGTPAWTRSGLPAEVAPVLVGDHLVLATTDRELVVLTLGGEERRRIALPGTAVALQAHGDLVVVLDSGGNLAAFEAPALQARWQQATGIRDGQCLLLGRGTALVADERGHTVAIDASNGSRRWRQDLDVELLPPMLTAGNDALLPTRTALLRFDLRTGAPGAKVAVPALEFHGGALALGNRLLLPQRDGVVQVLDLRGTPLYRIQTGRKPKLLANGDLVFVIDEDHVVHVFSQLR